MTYLWNFTDFNEVVALCQFLWISSHRLKIICFGIFWMKSSTRLCLADTNFSGWYKGNSCAVMVWFSLTVCTLCIITLRIGMIIYVSFFIAQFVITNCLLFGGSEYELSYKYNIPPGILKVITDMFLPHIGLSELEDECFSKILPKVKKTWWMHIFISVLCKFIL